jgi:DNA-binding CsgD family transcriptional regulator
VSIAWSVLKENPNGLPDFWATVYRNALEAAFRQEDVKSGVGLAIFAAISLESQGRPTVAITHLDDALAIFGADPPSRSRLVARRALVEALSSSPRCLHTLVQSRRGIRTLDAEAALDLDIYTAVIRAIMLQPDCVVRGERITASAPPPPPGMAAGTKPWIVAAMHAFGMAERSDIWITSLGAYADVARDVFRRADVAALAYATQSRAAFVEPDEEALDAAPRNTIARWRVEMTRLYLNLLRRDREAAAASVAALERLGERMNPIWRAGIPCYEAAREAWFEDGTESVFPTPPESVSAITLPAGLAGLNASSQAGSQDDAVLWRRWADASLPAHIQSSLGWPVSIDRLMGLSDIRLGRVERARQRFQRAARWAEAGGYTIERAIALLQLAELATLAGLQPTRDRWQVLRRRGRDELSALGLDPDPLAYQVARALALGRTSDFSPKLTPREVEVLSLLARGLTHREVGANLGISWRTAQVHAASAYGKLDASTRIGAITRARELGLLA